MRFTGDLISDKTAAEMGLVLQSVPQQLDRAVKALTARIKGVPKNQLRIAVMSEGSVLEVGSPEQLYETPKSRFVADFLGTMHFFTTSSGKKAPTTSR